MPSRVFSRNIDTPVQDPVEPQVQGREIVYPTEISRVGGQRKHVDPTNIQSSGVKKPSLINLMMEPENSENEWSLPTWLAFYLNKYLSTHIFERAIRNKILTSHPIPNSEKGAQKLDEHIKEL